MNRVFVLILLLLAGCKTVTTTTTEIRPTRFAILEFSRPVSHDSIVAYAQRVLKEHNLKIQSIDRDGGIITGGPIKYPARDGLPALDATVTISAQTSGAESRVRIYAASVLEANQKGGVDARLMELAQKIQGRLNQMIGS